MFFLLILAAADLRTILLHVCAVSYKTLFLTHKLTSFFLYFICLLFYKAYNIQLQQRRNVQHKKRKDNYLRTKMLQFTSLQNIQFNIN